MVKSKEKRQMLTDDDIQKFKVIVNFISDLHEIFGETNDSIEMYNILLEKTGLTNYNAIRKNITIFHEFLEENKNEIEKKDLENITGSIKYSDNIILNIKNILQSTDNDNRNEIWNHLSVLYSVIFNNNSNIITTNTTTNTNTNTTTNTNTNITPSGGDAFTNIVSKISNNVQNETSDDPGQIMQNMMQNGVFNELVNEMNESISNGDLDIGKMLGSLQNMLGNNNL
tara:strand:+ start:2680 stop:3360 length:681 start_codon:yes stop_codon:yes gene_type:complete